MSIDIEAIKKKLATPASTHVKSDVKAEIKPVMPAPPNPFKPPTLHGSLHAPTVSTVEHPKPNEEPAKPKPPSAEFLESQKILKEFGGLESNIPINHRYWRIRP